MAEEKEALVRIGYKIDQASVSAVDKAVAGTESRLVALKKSTAGVGEAAIKTGSALKDAFSRSETAIKADQKAVDDLRKSLTEAKDEADNLGKASGGGGKLNVEGLRRTGGALSALGLGDIGGGISRVGDIAEVGKELKNLGDAAKGLPGILGSIASSGAAAAAPLGATAAGIGAIALVAAPVALAVADVAIVMKLLQDSAEKATKAEKDRHDQELRQIEAEDRARKKSRTTSPEQSAQETGDLVADRAKQQKELDRLKARKAEIDAEYAALGSSFNPKARNDLKAAAAENQKAIDEQLAAMDKANQQYIENTQVLDPLIAKHEAERKAVQDLLNTTNAKSEADRLQAQALDRIAAATEGKTAATQKELQAIEANIKAASKATDDKIAQNQRDIAANNDLIASLEKLGPDNEAAAAKIKDLQAANAKLIVETDQLVKVTAPLIKQRQDEAEANAKAALANRQILDSILDKIKQGQKDAEKVGADIQKQVQEVVERDKRLAAVQQKFNDESAQLEERDAAARAAALQKKNDQLSDIDRKSLEARADLQGKYNNSLVDLARKSADEAADTLRKLEQQRADLSTSLTRDEQKSDREAADKSLELRIKAAREDERANREHYQRLEDIRRAAQDREADLILNRDFLGLFQSRRQTTRDLETENTSFVNKQSEASIARQQEAQDEQRAIEIQRRERLIAYQNQVQDLQTANLRELEQQRIAQARQEAEAQISYAREIEQQRIAKERQINELNISYQREINAVANKTANERATLSRAYDQELALAASYGKARVDNERKVQEALLAQAKSRLAVLNGGSTGPVMRAEGGGLAAGQTAFVNEPVSSGRETFSNARGTIALPGFGLFQPFAPGVVNANRSSSMKVDMPITINESRSPTATAGALRPMIYDVLEELTQP